MTDSADLIGLYSKRILALAASVPHVGRLDAPEGSATRRSPLCGSTVTVDVTMEGERIAQFGQDVKACALGQASASVLGAVAVGLTHVEAIEARNALNDMLKNDAPPPTGKFAELEVLSPARNYKNRHASILLAYDALLAAIDQASERRATG